MKREDTAVYQGNNKRRKKNRHNTFSYTRFAGGIFAVILVLACSFGFSSFFSSAHGNAKEDPIDYTYYKSVEIESGDSIWSIAEKYMGKEYQSVYEYIDELATINNMDKSTLDHIQEGDYLMVAYCDTQYK